METKCCGTPAGRDRGVERYFKEFPRNVALFDFYSASESTNEFTVHFFSMQNIGCRAYALITLITQIQTSDSLISNYAETGGDGITFCGCGWGWNGSSVGMGGDGREIARGRAGWNQNLRRRGLGWV